MKFEILKPSFSALACERICIFEGTARLKLYFVQRSKKFFFEMLLSGVVLIAKLCANLAFFSAVGILATSLRYRMQNDYKHLFNITVHRWLPRHSTLLENSVSQKMISLNSCTINGVILAVALLSSSSSARTASPVNERRNLDDDKINA